MLAYGGEGGFLNGFQKNTSLGFSHDRDRRMRLLLGGKRHYRDSTSLWENRAASSCWLCNCIRVPGKYAKYSLMSLLISPVRVVGLSG